MRQRIILSVIVLAVLCGGPLSYGQTYGVGFQDGSGFYPNAIQVPSNLPFATMYAAFGNSTGNVIVFPQVMLQVTGVQAIPLPYVPLNGDGDATLLPNGTVESIPGLPADECQNVELNELLPFEFDFPPGNYTATIKVINCGDGSVLASNSLNVTVGPPVATFQDFIVEVQDENANVLSQQEVAVNTGIFGQTFTLPQQTVKLGEIFGVFVSNASSGALVSTSESVSNTAEATHPINSSIFQTVTELFQGQVVVHFPGESNAMNQYFFPVHSGTVNVNFQVQGAVVTVPVQVTNCTAGDCQPQLGSSSPYTLHPAFDTLLMQYADRNGIPPQLLKAQVAQESSFNANAFRYEPLTQDFAVIAAPAKNGATPFGLLQQKAFAPWALATSNNCGTIIQPQGANLDLTSDDATARQKYSLTLGPNDDPRCVMLNALVITPSRSIAPTDTTPSMDNVFYTNDNATSNNWSASASSGTSQRFYDYQVGNPPFTSQTVIASSYGLHQVLYQTAVSMGYADQNGLGLSPGDLFVPATSLDLGSEYLARMFVQTDGVEQANYINRQDFQYQFAPALRAFNAGLGKKTGISVPEAQDYCPNPPANSKYVYPCTILNATPNYDPVPLPPANSGGSGGGTGPS